MCNRTVKEVHQKSNRRSNRAADRWYCRCACKRTVVDIQQKSNRHAYIRMVVVIQRCGGMLVYTCAGERCKRAVVYTHALE